MEHVPPLAAGQWIRASERSERATRQRQLILKIIHLLFQPRYLENETMYRGESKSVLRREVRTMWLVYGFFKMSCNFGVLGALSSDNFSRCYWELLRFGVIKLIMWPACPLCHKISSIFYKCNSQTTFPIRVSQRAFQASSPPTVAMTIHLYLKLIYIWKILIDRVS